MVRSLFYRTDSHRPGLEDVKCRRGTSGNERKIRATESVCGPLLPRLFSRFSGFHTCCSLYISHRVLYNCLPPLGHSHPVGLPAGGRGEDGIKWKTRKSDQPLRLSFHFWYYFARASSDVDVKHLPAFKRHALRSLCSPFAADRPLEQWPIANMSLSFQIHVHNDDFESSCDHDYAKIRVRIRGIERIWRHSLAIFFSGERR